MAFPQTRLRRLRATRALRAIARETRLSPADFVYPMFIAHGIDRREPITAMPGVSRLSIEHAVAEAGEAAALGIPAVLLFGIPSHKDEEGSGAWDDEGVVQLATRAIKDAHPDLLVIADLCLCEYTSHGHCGYQMDPANALEAVRESRLDLEEGADMLIVKPALAYLDVIRRVKDELGVPLAAYNVSGEYAMVKAAAAAGYVDERAIVLETL